MASPYITAKEIAQLVQALERTGYRIVKTLNEELAAKGFLVISGKVSRKYFYERMGLEMPMEKDRTA